MKPTRKLINVLSVILLCYNLSTAQDPDISESTAEENADEPTENIDKIFEKGNQMLVEKQFGSALPIWKKIYESEPENGSVNFKLGMCYRNSLDEQIKALPHFKKATEKMTDKYSFFNRKEDAAPFDALYFLAETYLVKNEPDSALDYFIIYMDKFNGQPPIDVNRNIIMCVNAKRARRFPRDITTIDLGNKINSPAAEAHPVVTLDRTVIFFSSRRLREDGSNNGLIEKKTGKHYEDIYMSVKGTDGKFQSPTFFRYNTDFNDAPLCLSSDGLTLFFRRQQNGVDNIYMTKFEDGAWQEPEELSDINSSFNESSASISGDGEYLYFTSDREGGVGKVDIYVAKRKGENKWGKAKNLGDVINTPFNEYSPFIHPNGNTLFFSSNGFKNKGMGGYDIYYSEMVGKNWTDPKNMGYPLNSTRDDYNYYITQGGIRFYTAITEKNSFDLYEVRGGGYEVENLDLGTEVVTLTQEMDVTEVLEVEKEIEKEVEVTEFIEVEVAAEKEEEVEEINLEEFAEEEMEEEEETIDLDVEAIIMDRLDSIKREQLIEKVTVYVEDRMKEKQAEMEAKRKEEEEQKRLEEERRKKEELTRLEQMMNAAGDFKTVYFDFNSSDLDENDKKRLDALVDFLNKNPGQKIEIIGHSDNKGDWQTNFKFSQSRAKVVQEYLVSKKVSPDRLIYYGKGSSVPIKENDTEAGRQLNRRVEIAVLK